MPTTASGLWPSVQVVKPRMSMNRIVRSVRFCVIASGSDTARDTSSAPIDHSDRSFNRLAVEA